MIADPEAMLRLLRDVRQDRLAVTVVFAALVDDDEDGFHAAAVKLERFAELLAGRDRRLGQRAQHAVMDRATQIAAQGARDCRAVIAFQAREDRAKDPGT